MIKQIKFILCFGIMLMALSGCKDKSSALIRTWKIDDVKYTREIPPALRPSITKLIDNLKKNEKLTYNADGTYTTIMGQNQLNGTWKLNWNSSKIMSTDDKGNKIEYTVVSLTPDKFVFKAIEGQSEMMFTMVPE